jgi:hypothetical protein
VSAVTAAGTELCALILRLRRSGHPMAYLGLALIVGVRTINLPRAAAMII